MLSQFEKEEKLFEKEKAKEEKKRSSGKRKADENSSMDLMAVIQQRNSSRESMFNGLIAGLEAKYGGGGKKEGKRSSGRNKK